ncbi:hypothetical protein L2E82_04650 [Cichorium intybus]|uniref:Uncharacterized protein n=1 Tax=Cichorium intybus TaxID=13427 RepID=A0ACB9H6Z0_CICIN|nr:hypothetical protein L2E82_04650 [Cichorium intybus]
MPGSLNISPNIWLKNCLIGEIKYLELLAKCLSIFYSTGIGECSVKYIGGLNVILKFENARVTSAFLSEHKESWSHWFSWLKLWEDEVRETFRAVWIKIYGVPVNFWRNEVFQIIAENFRRVLIPVECNIDVNNMSFGKICILTSKKEIFNYNNVKTHWRNNVFTVSIKEDGDWYPPLSSSDQGEDDGSEDDEEVIGINEDSDDDSFVEDLDYERINDDVRENDFPMCNNDEQNLVCNSTETNKNGDCNEFKESSKASDKEKLTGEEAENENVCDDADTHVGNDFNNKEKLSNSENEINSHGSNTSCYPSKAISLSNNSGPSSPSRLPDLNNPLPSSKPTVKHSISAKPHSRRSMSVKFKDIIRASNHGKKKSRKVNATQYDSTGSSSSDDINHSLQPSSSSSDEIGKTIQIGSALGYQVQGADDIIREVINGESGMD